MNNPGNLLLIAVPKDNDKKELSAEQMFATLHGILRPTKRRLAAKDQEHIGFEIAAIEQRIQFYIWTPKHLQNFVEGQVYAQYPSAQIFKLDDDYSQRDLGHRIYRAAELGLNNHDSLPIRTFPSFEVDPLSGITAVLSRLTGGEEIWIQILVRPIADSWHQQGSKYIRKIKTGGLNISSFVSAPFKAPEDLNAKGELSERDKSRIAAIELKNTKLGYQVKIRIVCLGQTNHEARLHLQAIKAAFKQFNTTDLNGFKSQLNSVDVKHLESYRNRSFKDDGFILNIEELASVFHLPHLSVDTPNIVWASAKTAEPPASLPTANKHSATDLSLFGVTNHRNSNAIFGALRSDRGRHTYVIGQTGTGKSGLLELLSLSDLYYDQGYAIIDPHGDFATNSLRAIGADKITDVVYFNPADTEFPIGFNPLEVTDSRQKAQISSELVGVMKRMFDSWGPRLEYILRNTLLALLDTPDTTMLDITRMLTDKKFRKRVVANVEDIVVKNFWQTEFASWDNRFQAEAIAPVLNKVGAFTANPMIRNIIGQPKSGFNIRQIMDQGKILILNISRGLVGEDNAHILGAMIITKIQLAAMSRADIQDIQDRRPFYLYVDEFQNFATDSFAVILSEARKYGLYLTLANQYISQMPEEVRSAVFGNVGSIISFRVSADDAPFLEKYFDPQFDTSDIIQLANRCFVATLTIRGEKVAAFSGKTLNLPEQNQDNVAKIIDFSRQNYAKPKALVEKMIIQSSSHQPPVGQPAQNKPSKQKGQQSKNKPLAKNKVLNKLKQGISQSQSKTNQSPDGKPSQTKTQLNQTQKQPKPGQPTQNPPKKIAKIVYKSSQVTVNQMTDSEKYSIEHSKSKK